MKSLLATDRTQGMYRVKVSGEQCTYAERQCCCSLARSCPVLSDPVDCSTLGFPVLHYLPEFDQIHAHRVTDAIQPPHPSAALFCFTFSQHEGLFQWVSSSHQVAKAMHLSFSISPSNEYSGLISFRIDWFDLLAVEGTLKSLLRHHSSKASIVQCSAFFMVQLSHPYTTTGKTVALTIQTFMPLQKD